MGYICDRAHQHHLEIHEKEYRSVDNGKSGRKEKTLKQQITGESVAKPFDDGNEDICKKHEENRKINQEHLAISSSVVDDNLIVVGGNDTDLDYNFYKYRKEKVNNRHFGSHHTKNKTNKSTLQPISISLGTIVGYANNFLVKLGKLAQQYVIVSKCEATTKQKCTTQKKITSTNKLTTAVNKINVSSGADTSKSQSRKNNAINPQAAATFPILVSSSSSLTSSFSSLSTNEICSTEAEIKASVAPGSEGVVGNCSSKKCNTRNITKTSSTPQSPSSHHHNSCGLVKHSFYLYAASSIIIALCYLTTPIVAYDAVHPM